MLYTLSTVWFVGLVCINWYLGFTVAAIFVYNNGTRPFLRHTGHL